MRNICFKFVFVFVSYRTLCFTPQCLLNQKCPQTIDCRRQKIYILNVILLNKRSYYIFVYCPIRHKRRLTAMSTIRDVAKLADVSTATVSRVLNHDPRYKITEETKNRVIAAVSALDYKFQPRTSRSRTSAPHDPSRAKIGCILSVTKRKYNDPYFMSILSGAEERLQEKGYTISFIRTSSALASPDCLVSTFEEDIAGLILMESLDGEIYDYIRSRVKNIVGIDTQRSDIDNVAYDHHQVGMQATQHLIELGHTKIGFIGGSGETKQITHSRRYQGYLLAMQSAGIEINPDWVIDCEWDEELCAKRLAELHREDNLPTAFFAASDLMAISAISAFEELHVEIPEKVAVIGMSDIEIARFTVPPLTTLRVPKEEIGIVAANLLVERICGSTLPPQKVTLPSKLIRRGTT